MKIFKETERLILREIVPGDLEGMYELDSDPEVHRYLGNKPVIEKSQSEGMIQFIRQQYVDNGIGRWAVINKTDNVFMGWSGLKLVTEPLNNRVNYIDLGYRLIRKYWGQGFASESAIASRDYAFEEMKLDEIFATALSDNKASNHILQKTGFVFGESFPREGAGCNWYHLNRKRWEEVARDEK